MTDDSPGTCSLGTGDLERRLAEIAAIGSASLIERSFDGRRNLLRFRPDADIRQRLEAVIGAEAECCSFLDLTLQEQGEVLVLSIAAPETGRATADGLVAAFAEHGGPSSAGQPRGAQSRSGRSG